MKSFKFVKKCYKKSALGIGDTVNKMKVALYLAAVLLGATATPSGYYHQQYNYKTSSSSYKNNELQHKTDDQGYYSKDGDLEGRTKPKVSSNSEHSEYVNPQLREGLNAGYLDAETDLSSRGNLLANSYGASLSGGVSSGYHAGSQYGNDLYSEGLASSDHIAGASGVYSAYGSGLSQSSYGSSGLSTVASRLKNDLQREIQEALRSQSRYSQQVDISGLEAELHRNLTARLNEILEEQYGTQTIRGGQSYSLSGGRVQARPNYEQNELENLQRQVENTLLQELRTSHSRSQQTYNQNYLRYESTTTYRPTTYRAIYPNLNILTTQRPFSEYPGGSKDSYYSQNEYNANRVSSNVRYTPVPNPLSITAIASNVQSQLDSQLNRLLEQVQRQYFSEQSGYNVYNLDSVLERLRQDLKNNLTYILDQELRGQYGTQVQKNNYMFSVGSGGETSGQYNYNVADLENLRRQMESNLLTKLNRDFASARQRWLSRQQSVNSYSYGQSSDYQYGSSSNNQRYDYSTARYTDDDYYRSTSASIVPLISSGVKGNQYHTMSGSQQSSYGSSGSSGSIVELQRKLQTDLGRQLQAAISQNQAYSSRHSSGGYGGSFEEAYQRLYDDLQRNLTQQLQEFEAGSGGYLSSYGSISDAQLASLKSQLQRNLASQLQSGLQQSYSASASYSASSGSSASAGSGAYSSSNLGGGYRSTRGSDNYQTGYSGYGQYRTGGSYQLEDEDCQGDDPNAYHTHRSKRSYGYRSQPLGLSTYSGSGYASSGHSGYSTGYNGHSNGGYGGSNTLYGHQQPGSFGQQVDDSDTVQQVEPVEFIGQQEIDVGQQVDDSDDTQQVEIDHGFGTFELGSQNKIQTSDQQHIHRNQERYTPQIENSAIGNLPSGNRLNQSNRKPSQYTGISGQGNVELESQDQVGQHVDNSDLTQQQQYIGFDLTQQNPGNLRVPNAGISGHLQSQINLGQEVDDSDLTQQVEDINFESPSHPKYNRKPTGYGSNIGTEVASNHLSNFGSAASHLQSTTQKSSIRQFGPQSIGQEIDETETNQQANQPSDFGVLGVGSQFQSTTPKSSIRQFGPQPIGQEIDETDTNQQAIQPSDFGVLGVGSHFQSTTPKSLIRQFGPQPIGQELDESETNQQASQSSDFGVLGGGSLIQTSTKKPQLTVGSNFDYQPNPNYENVLTNSQDRQVVQEVNHGKTVPENNFQTSRETNRGDQPLDYSLSNSDNLDYNNQKTIQAEHESNLDNNKFTSHYYIELNRPSSSLSAWHLPTNVKEVFKQIESNLTKQIDTTIKNDISYSTAPNQLYQNILNKWQNNINRECQKLLNDHSYYYLDIDQSDVNKLEKYLKVNLEKKLQQELQTYGFSQANLGINSFGHVHESNLDNQNSNFETSFYYGGQRYNQNSRGHPTKPVSSDQFIQSEINSQHDTNSNDEQLNINQHANPLPTLNQVTENNRQLYGGSSQVGTHYISNVQGTYSNRKPLPSGANYPDYTVEIGQPENIPLKPFLPTIQPSLERDSKLYVNTPKSFERPITNIAHVTPKVQTERAIGQSGYIPFIDEPKPIVGVVNSEVDQKQLQQTNNQWVDIEPSDSLPALPINKPIVDSEINLPSKPTEVSTTIKTNNENPLDLSNFPPLPPPQNSGSVIPAIQPQGGIPQQPLLSHTSTPWQTNIIDKQQNEQRLRDAEREADFLIETLRAAQQNRPTPKVNINQQANSDSYGYHHGSTTRHRGTTYLNFPNQYNAREINFENITPERLKIINQIDEEFTRIIEVAVQDQVKRTSNFQKSFDKLETELKRNLTECIEGTVPTHLWATDVKFHQYSDLISQKFEQTAISDLKTYLEIKLTNKLRERLTKAYKDYNENVTTPKSDRTSYQSPAGYEIIQVKLENITPEQFKIINQIDEEFTRIIDVAVQDQVKRTTSFQKSLDQLETELKRNLTECIEGNVHTDLGDTDFKFNQYSDLISQKFEQRKISNLKAYLEIKLIKKVRERLTKAYKDYNENVTTPKSDRTSYQSPAGYEIIQVKLENITPGQLKIINQIENDFHKQTEIAIQDHLASVSLEYLSSYENYQTLLNELEEELKNNITECVQGASEPGLDKYSDLILENFDQNKINTLEKYLQIKLTKSLRKSLETHFNVKVAGSYSIDSNSNRGSLNNSRAYHNYYSSHHYGVQYGHTHNINSDSERASEIKPIEFQHATVINSPSSYLRGVKGGKTSTQHSETPVVHTSYNNQNSQPNIETLPEPVDDLHEISEPTTEKASWWQRFGNKVKQGASKLKNKIVGES